MSKPHSSAGGFFWDSLQLPVLIAQLQPWIPDSIPVYVDTVPLLGNELIVRACHQRHVHLELGFGAPQAALISALPRAVALARVIATQAEPTAERVQQEVRALLAAIPDLFADAPDLQRVVLADPMEPEAVTVPKGVQFH